MESFLEQTSSLFYHCYNIRIVATNNTIFDAWPNAIIRNNLLYAADKIILDNKVTLRQQIDQLPLKKTHPFCNELMSGFPRGYRIIISNIDVNNQNIVLKKGNIFSFSIYLVGSMNKYCTHFFDAIRLMCKNGLGHPQIPFLLIDIEEKGPCKESQIMATGEVNIAEIPCYPFRLTDYLSFRAQGNEKKIRINYKTPTNLIRPIQKKDKQLSYQDKCNLFPGFYQLVRSAAYRVEKLVLLFCHPEDTEKALNVRECIESYLERAGTPILHITNIQQIQLKNTLKKEKINDKPLTGYVGELVFDGYFNMYLPLLKFMEELGVGNDLVYGLGRYGVEIGE